MITTRLLATACAAALLFPPVFAEARAAMTASQDDPRQAAQQFLDEYTEGLLDVYYASAQAEWVAGTDVSDEHTQAAIAANEALSAFTGAKETILRARELLEHRDALRPLQVKQLERVLLMAAENPGTIPDVVKKRVAAEARQSQALDGFTFRMDDGKEVTPNDIDDVLRDSQDLDERRRAWEAAKTVGPVLRDGLLELRDLRNAVAREMGYSSFFALQVADYGMTPDEMMALVDGILADVQPLYDALHRWTAQRLAERYGEPVPELIPAHWLGNRWGQEWPGLVAGIDLDPRFADFTPREIIGKAEAFYVSMGFPKLPQSFWDESDLYELPSGSARKKNTHASAWHLDLQQDVRSLMSVKPDFNWFLTTHHELGHIYYYIAYSHPDVPVLLREGANRAFHEGIGELITLAASQQSYLKDLGILGDDAGIDEIQWLLNEALNSVVVMPWAIGVMTHWEHDFYEKELPADQLNARWWELKRKYQKIAPPSPRGEEFCDPATKTHINDDPAQYYDYALATVLKYPLHRHIALDILKSDLRDANYRNNAEVGAFLNSILEVGATKDWRKLVRDVTGDDLSGKAMLEYYRPLLEWLEKSGGG